MMSVIAQGHAASSMPRGPQRNVNTSPAWSAAAAAAELQRGRGGVSGHVAAGDMGGVPACPLPPDVAGGRGLLPTPVAPIRTGG